MIAILFRFVWVALLLGLMTLGIKANLWWWRLTPTERRKINEADDRAPGEW